MLFKILKNVLIFFFLFKSILVVVTPPHLTALYLCAPSAPQRTESNSLTSSCTCTHHSFPEDRCLLEVSGSLWMALCCLERILSQVFIKKTPKRHPEDIQKTTPIVSHAGSSPVLVDATLAELSFHRKNCQQTLVGLPLYTNQ